MRVLAGYLLLACPAFAHVMSMSSGDLAIRGSLAHYEFRLPLYEMPHVANPSQSLFAHIVFSSGGRQAQLLNSACHQDLAQGSYVCAADYQFAAPVDTLDVECTFPAVTVPNHVHLLRVENGGKRDQALFDIAFPRATLRFRPPTPLETAFTQAAGGVLRSLGVAQILFLASLVVAARSRRELILLAVMFLAGLTAAALAVPRTAWQPPARFVEAAAALTVAYLALETLVLPTAGMRWSIVAVLGAFHGLYFALFLRTTGYSAFYVLTGAVCAEIALIAVCALLFSYVGKRTVWASVLLAIGLAWFFLCMWGRV
jgi:hypothetical protein